MAMPFHLALELRNNDVLWVSEPLNVIFSVRDLNLSQLSLLYISIKHLKKLVAAVDLPRGSKLNSKVLPVEEGFLCAIGNVRYVPWFIVLVMNETVQWDRKFLHEVHRSRLIDLSVDLLDHIAHLLLIFRQYHVSC